MTNDKYHLPYDYIRCSGMEEHLPCHTCVRTASVPDTVPNWVSFFTYPPIMDRDECNFFIDGEKQ